MAKARSQFTCNQCNATYPKWTGRCDNCGSWNSLVEAVIEATSAKSAVARASGKVLNPKLIGSIKTETDKTRIGVGIDDVNQVLGGGLVHGGVVLIAGQPGIGKSTLLMQIANFVATSYSVLYVSGEESTTQVKLRAERLGMAGKAQLYLESTTSANDIAQTIATGDYQLVIVDSIQTMTMAELSSASGTASQVTNCANLVIRAAKKSNTAVIIVGHITKDGAIAGPKIMEHLVDVVLGLEGDRYGGFKILRAVKNRYGTTSEVAILDMTEQGLQVVDNPSAALLAERSDTDGSIVLATMEGNRALLVEIQALVNQSSFGYAKRAVSGFDANRLNVLIAVLERRTKLKLSDKDIFINVVGGLKIQDRAADLAVCMAIASATAQRKLGDGAVVFGEVGLGGEIRSATMPSKRINEARKLGFKYAIAPTSASQTDNKFVVPSSDLRSILNKYLK